MLNDETERGCCNADANFVGTADGNAKDIVLLRIYSLLETPNVHATICQAALATPIVTTFFDAVSIVEYGWIHFLGYAIPNKREQRIF